jgi:hypothetical protein
MGNQLSVPAEYDKFVHQGLPLLQEVQVAAYKWDHFATYNGLEYALVGSFAARLQSGITFQLYDLEILLRPGVLANNKERLRELRRNWPGDQRLQITTDNGVTRDVIIIRENIGIALVFIEAGTKGYPDLCFPPASNSHSHYTHAGQPYSYLDLGYQGIQVPVLRPHLLLQQRLSCFEANSTDKESYFHTLHDSDDIQALLYSTSRVSAPFSVDVAGSLVSKVRDWIKFMDESFCVIKPEQWAELARLRLITVNEPGYVSGRINAPPVVLWRAIQVPGVIGGPPVMQPYFSM